MKIKDTLLGIAVALGTAVAATVAHAQTTAAGPYYASPSWDQTMTASTRFVVLANLGNSAVLDRETGVVWQRSPSAELRSYPDALTACLNDQTGGRRGWRLPSISELSSLFDPAVTTRPYLPAGHPFLNPVDFLAVSAHGYWSSTLAGSINMGAYYDRFVTGGLNLVGGFPESSLQAVWCVRAPGDPVGLIQ